LWCSCALNCNFPFGEYLLYMKIYWVTFSHILYKMILSYVIINVYMRRKSKSVRISQPKLRSSWQRIISTHGT
jgi:hypothetical protein